MIDSQGCCHAIPNIEGSLRRTWGLEICEIFVSVFVLAPDLLEELVGVFSGKTFFHQDVLREKLVASGHFLALAPQGKGSARIPYASVPSYGSV